MTMHEPETVMQPGNVTEFQGSLGRGVTLRVGVIDVGSNSVRMVVFDGVTRSPAYFFNEKILCGLGKGIHETGLLNPEGRKRALAALHRFVALSRMMRVTSLNAVATAAVRDADDGTDFCAQVKRETGLGLHVASGAQEAKLSSKGVLLGWPHADGIMCDIGGASMEFAQLIDGRIGTRETSPLGPLQLANLGGAQLVNDEIAKGLEVLHDAIPQTGQKIYLVGGSWRAIAKLDMIRRAYPLSVLHEYRMPPEQVLETCNWIATQTVEELSQKTDTSTARLELVPLAARVLAKLVKKFAPRTFSVSSYGLREGMFYEMMPAELRKRDPLLETARAMEMSGARFPGFGDVIYTWLKPVFADRTDAELRLIRAACLLHDIGWRAHPDYRAEVCFETVTRANLSGLDHEGRVFLGLAILHRYKGSAPLNFDPAILDLLSDSQQREAELLGRALRLGSMLTGSAPGALEETSLELGKDVLTLHLGRLAGELHGEVVDRRLQSLAAMIDRTGKLRLPN